MEIEEVGLNPEKLARAIHEQLTPSTGAVPLLDIAAGLDIVEIRREPLSNFEGALLMPPDRNRCSILVNKLAIKARQRFTIAHELGHYLNLGHRPNKDVGFACTKEQMRLWRVLPTQNQHQRQELEANRFAIELLAPRARFASPLRKPPSLSQIVSLADELKMSKEAIARRYVELHDDPIAIVFANNCRCLYSVKSPSSPQLRLRQRQLLPELPAWVRSANLTEFEEADASEWVRGSNDVEVQIQTLWQQEGYSMTLLVFDHPQKDGSEDEEGDGIDDTFERFTQFKGR